MKLRLLDDVLTKWADSSQVPKEFQSLRQQPVTSQKLIYFIFFLQPPRRTRGDVDWEILLHFVAHLLQSFAAIYCSDFSADELQTLISQTNSFVIRMRDALPVPSPQVRSLLRLLNSVLSFYS